MKWNKLLGHQQAAVIHPFVIWSYFKAFHFFYLFQPTYYLSNSAILRNIQKTLATTYRICSEILLYILYSNSDYHNYKIYLLISCFIYCVLSLSAFPFEFLVYLFIFLHSKLQFLNLHKWITVCRVLMTGLVKSCNYKIIAINAGLLISTITFLQNFFTTLGAILFYYPEGPKQKYRNYSCLKSADLTCVEF